MDLCALCVVVAGHGAISRDAKALGLGNGVHIGADEQEFPLPAFPLLGDQRVHLLIGETAAGVFHAIGDDGDEGVLGLHGFSGFATRVDGFLNRHAHGVKQGCAAAHVVIPLRHGAHPADVDAVVQQLNVVVKEYGGDHRFALRRLLLFEQRVVAADGVLLQP